VSWHVEDALLEPGGLLQPLQVVSGTHLDINITFLPPEGLSYSNSTVSCASCQLGSRQHLPAAAEIGPLLPAASTAVEDLHKITSSSPRVGVVFKSWRQEGRGAAVLSFDWSSLQLVFDFDEPFPSAYDPHPADTPESRRIGGKLRNYEPGMKLWL
jgi:hypothetical protein